MMYVFVGDNRYADRSMKMKMAHDTTHSNSEGLEIVI
jgi:hypothetical protein